VGNFHRAVVGAIGAVVLLSGCTGGPQATGGQSDSALPAASGSASPTESTQPSSKPSATATTRNQPVPKVQRSGGAAPSITSKPSDTDGTVKYSDGVTLKINDVKFAKETKEGPGRFPGRAYAVLSLEIENGSKQTVPLDTVVVTVLDKSNKPVSSVYVEEAKVSDFSGDLAPGKSAKANYAFALPASSRSKVTVVIDFDGTHTSAVFRGGLD